MQVEITTIKVRIGFHFSLSLFLTFQSSTRWGFLLNLVCWFCLLATFPSPYTPPTLQNLWVPELRKLIANVNKKFTVAMDCTYM